MCLAGWLGGLDPVDDFNPLLQMPSGVYFTFFGSFVFGTPDFPVSDIPLQSIVDKVAKGVYKAKPVRVFRFDEIRQAHEAMESNQANDVMPALYSLRATFRLFAFSNGKRSEIDAVLSNANILEYFEGIVTADDVRSSKPDPAVYSYARRVTGAWSSPFWLLSSNPWDVIGARSAGLSAAWVQRSEQKVYDPWGIEPNVTVRSLTDLPAVLGDGATLSENQVNDRTFFQPAPELEGNSNDYLQLR